MFWIIAATAAATGVAFVLIMNFVIPEKRLERHIAHRYGVADPQFKREMGVLMGPAVLPGNGVVALQNGNEIFPTSIGLATSAGASRRRSAVVRAREWRCRSFSTGPAA